MVTSAVYAVYHYVGNAMTYVANTAPVSLRPAQARNSPAVSRPSPSVASPRVESPAPVATRTAPSSGSGGMNMGGMMRGGGMCSPGTYTGDVADAYYGNVQVSATVACGKITDVAFLQYPNDRSTSRQINSYAMPILRQEAIAAQSANVDAVSGATHTSQAFVESLSSALTKAGV
ncbi:MAG TPA: FMN-binding protein [Candidatus Paceibacterota bacterium]